MEQVVHRRYAQSLFDVASEKGEVNLYYDAACLFLDVMDKNKDVLELVAHPHITSSEKMSIMEKAFKGSVPEDVLGLISVALNKGRENELVGIFKAFTEIAKKERNIEKAVVISAKPLTKKQTEDIRSKLAKLVKKDIELELNVVPEIIGGLIIKVCGKVMDSSIKNNLSRLKTRLLKDLPERSG